MLQNSNLAAFNLLRLGCLLVMAGGLSGCITFTEEQQFYMDREWQKAKDGVFWSQETPSWREMLLTEDEKARVAALKACTHQKGTGRVTRQDGISDSVATYTCAQGPDATTHGGRILDAMRGPKGHAVPRTISQLP